MKRFRNTKPTRFSASLLSSLLCASMFLPSVANAASASRTERGFGPVYDAAHESTFEGSIQEVVTQHTVGSPAGMHLMVAGPSGLVDTHVGPFLSKETKAALQAGVPVRIVGASTTLHGKTYFLARQLTVDGNTITVRSQNGLLVRGAPRAERAKTKRPQTQTEQNGVAR